MKYASEYENFFIKRQIMIQICWNIHKCKYT